MEEDHYLIKKNNANIFKSFRAIRYFISDCSPWFYCLVWNVEVKHWLKNKHDLSSRDPSKEGSESYGLLTTFNDVTIIILIFNDSLTMWLRNKTESKTIVEQIISKDTKVSVVINPNWTALKEGSVNYRITSSSCLVFFCPSVACWSHLPHDIEICRTGLNILSHQPSRAEPTNHNLSSSPSLSSLKICKWYTPL